VKDEGKSLEEARRRVKVTFPPGVRFFQKPRASAWRLISVTTLMDYAMEKQVERKQ